MNLKVAIWTNVGRVVKMDFVTKDQRRPIFELKIRIKVCPTHLRFEPRYLNNMEKHLFTPKVMAVEVWW